MPRVIALLLALVLGLTGIGAATPASAAAGDGYISGTVTNSAGQPLAGVWVHATYYRTQWDDWAIYKEVQTDANGRYQLGPLESQTYRVDFESVDGYLPTAWPQDIAIAGQTVTGVDARLVKGGSISGTVTNPSGDEVDSMFVQLWWRDTSFQMWTPTALALTSQGEYEFGNLGPGSYRIEFQPTTFMPEFWDDAATVETAKTITITTGRNVTGIDAQLEYGTSLSGTITGTADAQLSGIRATAYRFNSATKSWEQRATATSGDDGSYLLRGLAAGTYRLGFWDPSSVYTTEYWLDAASLETATSFTIGTDDVFDQDVELSTTPFPAVTNITKPLISGTAQIGKRLTASTGTWAPATGLAFTYQWMIDDRAVPGATSATFVPGGGVGKNVQVVVFAARAGHTTDFEVSAPTAPVLQGAVTNTAPPSISGVARVGARVTASPGTWEPFDATVGYQWLVDGKPVSGATSSSYVARAGDRGRSLSVRTTGSMPPWTSAVATSRATKVGVGVLTTKAKPKVSGKPRQNAVLRVSPGRWSPAAVKVKFQWYAGAKAIRKATAAKLKLAGATLEAVRKKAISVRVKVSAPGYTTVVTRVKVRGTLR